MGDAAMFYRSVAPRGNQESLVSPSEVSLSDVQDDIYSGHFDDDEFCNLPRYQMLSPLYLSLIAFVVKLTPSLCMMMVLIYAPVAMRSTKDFYHVGTCQLIWETMYHIKKQLELSWRIFLVCFHSQQT
ncbi:hypothetical protein MIR68_007148 [Amoeboaphelidium protococcarum]|nr:hypothetical protein MIR68_007148 [Amoeboaphelidium protococcarum]